MSEASAPKRVTRRTVAKGAAWTVPAVAVAVPAASAAVSPPPPPPPPEFDWLAGCGTTGNGNGGCNGVRFTAQVPFFVRNTTAETLEFQIVGAKFWPENAAEPANYDLNYEIWENNGTQDDCGTEQTTLGCEDYVSITVAPDECRDLWVVGSDMGNASSFGVKIRYRWVAPDPDCTVLLGPLEAFPDAIISPNNCDGLATELQCTTP